MKFKIFLLVFLSILITSCSSTKKASAKSVSYSKADKIVLNASSYLGTKYKYGGTTKRGMDCSGLVFTAFKSEKIQLPRVSIDMAKKGRKISLKKVQKGDLLFFKTSRKNRINHVGIVSYVRNGIIKFIHSSTSRGVIESSLSEKYWKKAFTKATKIL